MRKIKKIVDLSWEFTAETPIYPGDPEPSVTVATTLEKYSLQGTTQGRYLTGGVPPVRFSM